MKRSLILALIMALVISLSGCSLVFGALQSMIADEVEQTPDIYEGEEIVPLDGFAYGREGDCFHTEFFDFIVEDIEFPEEFEEYTPKDGMQLVKVTFKIRNTFSEALPMFDSDFQLQWHDLGDKDEDFSFAVTTRKALEGVMPEMYTLKRGETVVYSIVYEAPEQAEEFSVSYLEEFDDNTTGNAFFCFFEK